MKFEDPWKSFKSLWISISKDSGNPVDSIIKHYRKTLSKSIHNQSMSNDSLIWIQFSDRTVGWKYLYMHLPRIKLAASNFTLRFIGGQGNESSIFGNFAPPEYESASGPLLSRDASRFCDSHAYRVCAACGLRIGMCGYTAVPEDGHTCLNSS